METITFRITGTYPLLQHNPLGSMKAGGGPATIIRKVIPTPEEEAERAAFKREDGTYYQKTTAIRSALIDAGVGRRIGKMGASKVLSGAVFTTGGETGLYHPATLEPITSHTIDLQRVVVQKNGVMRGRARIDHWMCEVEFEYDELEVTPAILLELLNVAGRRVGIGDYRPRCPNGKGGPYGRFTAEIVA